MAIIDPRGNTGPKLTPHESAESTLGIASHCDETGGVMDYASCHVVYVDRTASEDETRTRDDAKSAALHTEATNHADGTSPRHASVAQVNLKILLDTFGEGWSFYVAHQTILTLCSSHLYFWQNMYSKITRPLSQCDRGSHTYPPPYRHSSRRPHT